ncbi:hypothetical protein BGZ95_002039 [Linnemannia exigua]|uniref:Uncharacterized protein n=1 Tax=Linnemannia exigua TaxID=604196 RepID=A0AAD4H8L6_9FUNG|nr:hypothetical protein BGZ95_002039 [Linnemannia exigua]
MEVNSPPTPPPRQSKLRSCLVSYTTAHQTPLALIVRILRTLILLLATANLIGLLTGIEVLPPYESNRRNYNFQDTSHLTANTFILLAGVYSFFGRAEWSWVTRLVSGLTLAAWCLALNISEIKNIHDEGGCANGPAFSYRGDERPNYGGNSRQVSNIRIRCRIQMVVSSLSITWAVLLIAELFLTNTYRRRLMIKYGLDRPTELEAIHVYQPDLSLNAGDSAPAAAGTTSSTATGTAGIAGAGAGVNESETLPAYEARPTGPRVHIVDMTRASRGPPPPAATATTQGATGPESTATSGAAAPLAPPPSYQAPHF